MKELKELLKTNVELSPQKATIINIFHTSVWIKDDVLAQLKPYDLSIEQFNVLRILRGQKGKPINLQDIQERMVSKMSNTTRLVDKLIKKDFVKRTICKANRRKVEIVITNMGLNALAEVDPIVEATENNLTQNLSTEELEHLNKLLIKLKNK